MTFTNRAEVLHAQGWTRQFLACEPRLSESVELYESLGFEVLLEPLPADPEDEECRTCLEADPDRYRIIYTRKVAGKESVGEGDLLD